ncbi:MAG: DNA-directed RNA polymerase subunit alpha [Omnitrophica WOR_2 bacterium GWF2_43_52]|nr:MAG: DNA-directed RNA polymerase subunit alpha [Omnitrophica WOR_2 bacterium GWC2_44_8]OGX20334.1 MAG: DNA-directed RNA polymerase subunit alpha [Omnitrophica WOR_2 bacterium GWF2_43_52]OGX56428.1 MAG: DNA-directed RNA polymerase subunit alpha [Omnitrophica WOR_2 bacterium RIFOXYC2_FULL_43_9]HAH21231.1 DNA-directed RNA polymerase subunit alpha [Candidatus Omnitrophota bacterium]HBG63957.1 DNA-directed RNA polymerase subunit alpha [Candidatus Omnitrophota bacterium]
MGIKWRDFQMPKRLECDESSYSQTYGKFMAEPFERGYGVTLGNSLRRVLLSSIDGAAVTSIKFEASQHEFSALPGVVEDVTEMILNIKKLVLRSHSKTPKTMYIKKKHKGEITAADIETDETIEVINKGLHIATLTKDTTFSLEMEVAKGRGYVAAEFNKKEDQPIGVIAIDSIFSPVIKVAFTTENARVGQRTDYDRLILEIWTNGAMSPKDALLYASNILQRHLDVFVNFGKLPEEEIEQEPDMQPDEIVLYEKLRLPIAELELSVRSSNCFSEEGIKTIADLVKHSEDEMLSLRNFGKKSLTEIKELLASMGLSLGMKVDNKKIKQK